MDDEEVPRVTTGERGTYLYCVVRSRGVPDVGGAPRGLAGAAPVRAIDVGHAVWLVVADVPLSRYGTAAIAERLRDLDWVSACAMAHESVVEHFASASAIVPAKLFTIFTNDDRAVQHVRRARSRVDRALDRVAGRTEFGVRVKVDTARAPRTTIAARTESGTGFLRRKRQERHAVGTVARSAREALASSFATLARHADATIRRRPPTTPVPSPLVLDAAFLVRSTRVAAFEAAAVRVAERLRRDGCELTVTGPWPPYNFVGKGR